MTERQTTVTRSRPVIATERAVTDQTTSAGVSRSAEREAEFRHSGNEHPTCEACGAYLFESITGALACLMPYCVRRFEPAGRADRDTGCVPDDLRAVGS